MFIDFSSVVLSARCFLFEYLSETIAFIALLTAVYSSWATRRHNRLSVKPHLATYSVREYGPKEGTLNFYISNQGLGPALIKKYELFVDEGAPLKNFSDVEDAIRALVGKERFNHSTHLLNEGAVIVSGESVIALKLHFSVADKNVIDVFEKASNKFELVVEYESMYGQRFKYDSRKIKGAVFF